MLTNFCSSSALFATKRSMASGIQMLLQDFQAFEEEFEGELGLIVFPQPHGVCASRLGLHVGACSGYGMGSDRFHSSLLSEDLSMLNSGTFLCSRSEKVK